MIDVFLNDDGKSYEEAEVYYAKADQWARDQCPSYQGHHVQDVADFSLRHDIIARYIFDSEQDVVLFKLKWS